MMNSPGALEYRRTVSDGPNNTESSQDGIPADDGMQDLRQKLHEVRILAVSTEEKARRMHALMMKQYTKQHATNGGLVSEREHLDTRPDEQHDWEMVAAGGVDENPYKLRPGDTDATISPLPNRPANQEDALEFDDGEEDKPTLGCKHYKRNVKVQCFDCERWFNCRHCHDAAQDLPFPHSLNRKKTRHMLCMLCKTPQLASECCINCGEYAAWYYCSKCKLWDNEINKCIYHCDDCGLCRIGQGLGKDFVHCRRCNVCISISTSSSHPCIERATDSDCPLCLSYLFESTTPVISLPCGHYMHGECYKDLMAVTYKCPVCNKSAVNMELQWRKLDDEIRAQPMPEDDDDLRNLLPHVEGHTPVDEIAPDTRQHRPRQVWIGCNDCGGRSSTAFHWLGLKCQVCGGYNTNQMAPPAGRESEAERLLRQQAQHRQHDFTGNYVLHDVGIGRDTEDQDSRVDSALDTSSPPPDSPTLRPPMQYVRRTSDAQSPSRRYFVQAEEQRRSSFTTPRFGTPTMPALPTLPNLPRMPDLPRIRGIRDIQLPSLPTMSSIELSRFSPYEMATMLSSSLSPMRYQRDGSASVPTERRQSDLQWRNSAPPGAFGRNVRSASSSDGEEDGAAQQRPSSSGLLTAVASKPDETALTDRTRERERSRVSARQPRAARDRPDDEDIFAELIGHP